MLLNPFSSSLFICGSIFSSLVTTTNQEKKKNSLGTFFISTALSAELTDVQANYNDMQLFRKSISLIMFPLSQCSLNYLLEETRSIL